MKRIVWLSNNRLRHSLEVPFLRNLGYEVYEPKTMHFHCDCAEDDIFYDSDEYLSIDKAELEKINKIDFWNTNLSWEEKTTINSKFDVIIFDFELNVLKSLVRWFKGIILCRVYGLESGQTYSDLLADDNPIIFSEIDKISNRFRFIKPYERMFDSESEWFRSKVAYAPIPLEGSEDKAWNCLYRKVAIWAPEINSCRDRKKVYSEVSSNLKALNCVIYGNQTIPLKDGDMFNVELRKNELLKCSSVVFASANDDFLPLEVMMLASYGVPVIHKAGSQLSRVFAKYDALSYRNDKELYCVAKKSIKAKFVSSKETECMVHLKEYYSKNKCRDVWQNMISGLNVDLNTRVEALKVAFVMPNSYLGGILDFTKRIAIGFAIGASNAQENVQVTVYHPEDNVYKEDKYFEELGKYGIKTRQFRWVKRNHEWLDTYYKIKGYPVSKRRCNSEVWIIEDDLDNLSGQDYVFMTSDYTLVPYVLPIRYSDVVHDVIQRFEPLVMDLEKDREQKRQFCIRTGEKAIVTTEPTRNYVVNYEGIDQERTVLIPQMFDVVKSTKHATNNKHKYFIWATNKTPHKNHFKAFKALIDYYEKGGVLDCYMTGADVKMMDPDYELEECYKSIDYLMELRKKISASSVLRKHLIIKGNLLKTRYIRLLEEAVYTFHPGHSDNGNGAVVDAVQLGVPVASSDYPAMRYMNERMNLKIHFFDWNDAKSITEALFFMEEHAREIKKQLPDNQFFYKFTNEGQADYIYDKLMPVIRG